MIGVLARYLAHSTPAARRLLALLAGVFVPLLLIFAVALPLVDARTRTARALAEAEAVHRWVHDQAAALPPAAFSAEAAAPPPEAASGPIGISALEASLVAAGLRDRVARLANQQDGTVEIDFDAVPFRAVTDWLEANAATWGYGFARLDIERADQPGHVTARLDLAPLP